MDKAHFSVVAVNWTFLWGFNIYPIIIPNAKSHVLYHSNCESKISISFLY